MKVTLIQTGLLWQDPEGNLLKFEKHINSLPEPSDLIILPEMFSTGFTMQPELHAQNSGGLWLEWMKKMAGKSQAAITGSLAIKENGRYYNRMYFVRPGGETDFYDKRHLFRMGGEHEHYSQGIKKQVLAFNGWLLCPMVCYDLRFPVWSRNRFSERDNRYEYDVLIYVANWPAARNYAWKQLLIARAIENQCYVIGVNRVGADGNGVDHSGDSIIIGPKGETLITTPENEDAVVSFQIDKPSLERFREQFPAGLDADNFKIHL